VATLTRNNRSRYTQNTTFAKQFTYPLLVSAPPPPIAMLLSPDDTSSNLRRSLGGQEGLNAWWGCFLTKIPKAGGGYSYNDISTKDPGEEHEGQCVPHLPIVHKYETG
jgi:hypothetical protein